MKKMGVLKLGLAVALSAVVSNAFLLTGTVSNENGEKIKGADVTLIGNNLSTKQTMRALSRWSTIQYPSRQHPTLDS